MGSIKIISYHVRGLHSPIKRKKVLNHHKPDVKLHLDRKPTCQIKSMKSLLLLTLVREEKRSIHLSTQNNKLYSHSNPIKILKADIF